MARGSSHDSLQSTSIEPEDAREIHRIATEEWQTLDARSLKHLRLHGSPEMRACWPVAVSVRHPRLFLAVAARLARDEAEEVRRATTESIADAVIIGGEDCALAHAAGELLESLQRDTSADVRAAAAASLRLIEDPTKKEHWFK